MNERDIFTAASLIDDQELRSTFLATVCKGNSVLEQRIMNLLQAGQQADEIIDIPQRAMHQLVDEVGAKDSSQNRSSMAKGERDEGGSGFNPGTLNPGTKIGPYQILQILGEGGMGIVYAAKQSEPVKRQVALKILRPGDTSQKVLARFEQERHALSMMEHSGIARILDAGSTADGLPYFVMELVKGIPINQYCDQENLSPQERLQLFIPVCAAVQHAHQKGIIHRDLKPSNILVALYDGKPKPKVIDFGVAKAIGVRLSETSVYTEIGSVVGTLEYMAPEQAELNNLDIDTRADIYSLGVVLYELLTGSPPFSRQQLRIAAFDEMLRIIREVEPPKPSTKVSSSEEAASVAAHRKLEPKQLAKALSGDLDWVVMKSLAKERTHRYQTVGDFAADINRFLNVEPVSASPPSFAYRAKRFLMRNRVLSIATAITLVAIMVGTVAAIWGYLESSRQSTLARQSEANERNSRQMSETRLKQVESGINVLSSIFDDLNPDLATGSSGDLRGALVEKLKGAARQIDAEELGDSQAVAKLQYRLGLALLNLGEPEVAHEAMQLAERAFRSVPGDENLDLLNCLEIRSTCLRKMGKLEESLELSLIILPMKQKILGLAHIDTIATINNLGLIYADLGKQDKAIEQFEQAVNVQEKHFGADAESTMSSANNLAVYRLKRGDIKNSRKSIEDLLARRTRVLGPDHPDTLQSMMSFSLALRLNGEYKRALAVCDESLERNRVKFGSDHPQTIQAVSNLGMMLMDLDDFAKAIPLLEQVQRHRMMKLGSDHPDTLSAIAKLAVAYKESGRLNEAMPLYVESLDKRRKVLGSEHQDTLTSMNNLGTMLHKLKKYDEAIPLLEECLELRTKILGEDHPDVGVSQLNLARCYQDGGRLEEAVKLYRQSLVQRQKSFASDHPRVLAAMYCLAIPLRRLKQYDEAIELIKTALERGQKLEGGLPQDMKVLPEMLAEVLKEAGRLSEAEDQMRSILESYHSVHGKNHEKSLLAQLYLGQLLLQRDKIDEAEMVLRENLDLRIEMQPEDWQTFMVRGVLGGLMIKKREFAEAEVLLKQSYEGLSARTTLIPPDKRETRLNQVRKWLVELYFATDRNEEAEKLEPEISVPSDGK